MTMDLTDSLNVTPKAKATKEHIDTWDYIKIKNVRASKDILKGLNSSQKGRKYLKTVCLTRVCYLDDTLTI